MDKSECFAGSSSRRYSDCITPDSYAQHRRRKMTRSEGDSSNMDSLLATLRSSMVELSVQGDDFTRQICHMYDVFEDFIDEQTLSFINQRDRRRLITGSPQIRGMRSNVMDKDIMSDLRTYSPPITKREKRNFHRNFNRLGRPLSAIATSTTSIDECSSLNNPLLDTISVLATDRYDSDDEYTDVKRRGSFVNKAHFDSRSDIYADGPYTDAKKLGCEAVANKMERLNGNRLDMDKDSVGYAGSNSIDSGYKSCCPTPDLSDSCYYNSKNNEGTSNDKLRRPNQSDTFGSRSLTTRPMTDGQRRLIGDGCCSLDRPVKKKKKWASDSSYYDANLDHLMYLRQSLISAMDVNKSNGRESCSQKIVCDQSIDDTSNDQSAKVVRFREEEKMEVEQSADLKGSAADTAELVRSKSILKDSLCANIRSQIEKGLCVGSVVEEEIDQLLYGNAEYYDLESVEDFPNNYVTSTTDCAQQQQQQHRTTSRLAKVKKLNNRVTGLKDPSQETKTNEVITSDVTSSSRVKVDYPAKTVETSNVAASSSSSPKPEVKKKRFTEVAKCMLEIIDDFQRLKLKTTCKGGILSIGSDSKKTSLDRLKSGRQPDKRKASSNQYIEDPIGRVPNQDRAKMSARPGCANRSSPGIRPASEYHVYEEILYDSVANQSNRSKKVVVVPPPLPARPTKMKVQGRHTTGQRPKQRSNLYSLFTEQSDRRSISKSLEREFVSSSAICGDDSEYGFKTTPTTAV